MKILIDSREQIPLDFKVEGAISEITTDGLPIGDYWGLYESGETMPVIFERKEIADLFGSLTSGMERFKREIKRAQENNLKLVIIINGTIKDILEGAEYSSVNGSSILKTLFTLWVKYDVIPVFCRNKTEMKRFILETWSAIGRNYTPGMTLTNNLLTNLTDQTIGFVVKTTFETDTNGIVATKHKRAKRVPNKGETSNGTNFV